MINRDYKFKPTHDYMKYWRVIRYWIKAKHKIGTAEIDMMFFLYSEHIFSRAKFKEFEECMSWNEPRFHGLLKDGWVRVWRKRGVGQGTLYELSYKGKRLVTTMYQKLNGEEIAETAQVNPLFRNDASYMDKIYRNMIVEMNKENKAARLK